MESRFARNRVAWGTVVTAAVIFVGIVIVGAGYLRGGGVALDAGLLVTLAGVSIGIQRLVLRHRS
jgi:hypothetical protein